MIFSAGLAVSRSASKASGCAPLPSANANLTPSPCCASIGRIRRYIQTCDAWTLPLFAATASARSTSSAAASPASPSASLASAAAPQTSATCGPSLLSLSEPVSLQQSLVNRLRARLDVNGSPEYSLTWKEWAISGQEPICALRASAHRTSVNVYTGWPTPCVQDGPKGGPSQGTDRLPAAAALAGWPTPNAQAFEAKDLERLRQRRAECKSRTGNGNGFGLTLGQAAPLFLTGWKHRITQPGRQAARPWDTGVPLSQQVTLAGWPSPQARDEKGASLNQHGTNSRPLNEVALLAGWGTPRVTTNSGHGNPSRSCDGQSRLEDQVHGAISTLSPAQTEKRGALNPAHSRWLQGYPVEWCQAAIRAYRKRKRPPKHE